LLAEKTLQKSHHSFSCVWLKPVISKYFSKMYFRKIFVPAKKKNYPVFLNGKNPNPVIIDKT